jgi:murein DD-endopeptidase MepM/ murein hydrolase activator NlpD
MISDSYGNTDLLGRTLALTSRKVDPASPEASSAPLKAAAKELESLFIYELLKEMRQTTQGGLLGKGLGNEVYSSLFDMEIARLFAQRGFGLADLILKQMDLRRGQAKGDKISPNPQEGAGTSAGLDNKSSGALPEQGPKPGGSDVPDKSSRLRFPVQGKISSFFGWRDDPFSGVEKFHAGVDVAAQVGQEIHPLKKGRVLFSGLTQGYGNAVVIDHEDGLMGTYGHNLINLVSAGDEVDPEQVIALVGNTGKSTGPHLHFELQYKGKKIDPLGLLSAPASSG